MAESLVQPLKLAHEKQKDYGIANQPVLSAARRQEKGIKSYTPDNVDESMLWLMQAVEGLLGANSMDDVCKVMRFFERDLVSDANTIITTRKGHLRLEQYLITRLVKTEFVTKLVRMKPVADKRHLVEFEGTYYIYPRRTWLVWPTMLLPKSVPIQFTNAVGVRGPLDPDQGRVEYIISRARNWPPLPVLLRVLNGVLLGALPHATEPIWGYVAELLGDDFYRRKRQREAEHEREREHGDMGAVESVKDMASHAFNTMIDYGDAMTRTFGNYTRYAMDTLTSFTCSAAETASQYSQRAYERMTEATSRATQAAYDIAGSATDTVRQRAATAAERARQTTESIKQTSTDVGERARAAVSADVQPRRV